MTVPAEALDLLDEPAYAEMPILHVAPDIKLDKG